MKSRVIFCLIACLGVLFVAGCGGDDESTSDTAEPATTEETTGLSGVSGVSGETASDDAVVTALVAGLKANNDALAFTPAEIRCLAELAAPLTSADEIPKFGNFEFLADLLGPLQLEAKAECGIQDPQ